MLGVKANHAILLFVYSVIFWPKIALACSQLCSDVRYRINLAVVTKNRDIEFIGGNHRSLTILESRKVSNTAKLTVALPIETTPPNGVWWNCLPQKRHKPKNSNLMSEWNMSEWN